MNVNPKEVKIIRWMADGLTTKEISEETGLKVHSIETYKRRLMLKVGAKNGIHLVAMAFRDGILSLEPCQE